MDKKKLESAKNQTYVTRWEKTRSKGKLYFIFTRGLSLGLGLFLVWAAITLLETGMSDFNKAVFTWNDFLRRALIWLVVELVIGFVLAQGWWKRQEEKYEDLSSIGTNNHPGSP